MRKWFLLSIQILVSCGLLAWIFGQESFRFQVWKIVGSAHTGWLLAGMVAAGISCFLGVFRWRVFLRMGGIVLPFGEVLRLYWIGLLCNSFLMGAVGGDAVKVAWLCVRGYPQGSSLSSVLLDRMSGFFTLIIAMSFLISSQVGWLWQSSIVARITHGFLIYLGLIIAGIVLSFILTMRRVKGHDSIRLPYDEKVTEFARSYVQFLLCWRQTLQAMAISVVMLTAYFFTFYCSAEAFGVHLTIPHFFAVMPLIDLISSLPVSFGGFGVREEAFSELLGQLCGTPASQAVSVSLGGAFIFMFWGLLGVFLLPSYRRAAALRRVAA